MKTCKTNALEELGNAIGKGLIDSSSHEQKLDGLVRQLKLKGLISKLKFKTGHKRN